MKKSKPTKNAATGLTSAVKPQNAELSLYRLEDETEEASGARGMLNPVIGAAVTMKRQPTLFAPLLNVNAAIAELENQCKAVADGNLARGESMLVAQAHTLDALFNHLAVLAAHNLSGSASSGEMLYRLAFRAQAQCRANIEALAEIKNPRTVSFVKQANIAAGNQQVNNGDNVTVRAGARTRENEIPPNKLLTETNYETLDARRTLTTSGVNSPMEAVGEINGAADEAG
jgi:hypothetical protein